MVRYFSEEEGSFPSDNYISNETSYLHVIAKLHELGVSGGAYLGVGPEQNFTYIAKIRPEIAFIVDIRREAIIQHMMYKAIFQLSTNRTQFLSRLFSKPIDRLRAPGRSASAEELVNYFEEAPTSQAAYTENLALLRKIIETDFQFPLLPRDQELLDHVYTAFRQANLGIVTRWYPGAFGGNYFGGGPTLKDLILETDQNGDQGNFLASDADYEFVRDLQRRNRIIPVVGDFAGTKALATVADYLRKNGYTVSAFYTSNVEQYLFGDNVFDSFAENVRKLPIDDKSVFIRGARMSHPAHVPGHRMTTILEKITTFVQDFEAGLYTDYGNLVNLHYISGNDPCAQCSENVQH